MRGPSPSRGGDVVILRRGREKTVYGKTITVNQYLVHKSILVDLSVKAPSKNPKAGLVWRVKIRERGLGGIALTNYD